jgi:hypothetical protein
MKRFVLFLAALTLGPAPAQVPNHIPTMAYDENSYQGENASAGDVRRLLTYGVGGLGNDKAVRDCRGSNQCYSVFYFDPHLVYDSQQCPFSGDKQFLAAASESWFVHQAGYSDQAHRVHGTYTQTCKGQRITVPVYAVNESNPAVQRYYASYLQQNGDDWDYYEMDDTATTVTDQLYGPGGGFCKDMGTATGYCTTSQEIADDNALEQAHKNFVAALNHRDGRPMRFVYNSIKFGPTGARLSLLFTSPRIVGAVCENCIVNAGAFRPEMYAKVLDAMAAVDTVNGKQFVELNTGRSPDGSNDQIAQRLVTTAVAWLGFADGQTVVWPNLEYSSHNLAIWPEDQIYPTQPVQTMARSNAELSVMPSVWRREFRACYMNGKPIGPCAAVLNASSSPVVPTASWFRSTFSHAVALRGGDALSGGSVDFTSAPVGAVAPGRAVLLVR